MWEKGSDKSKIWNSRNMKQSSETFVSGILALKCDALQAKTKIAGSHFSGS